MGIPMAQQIPDVANMTIDVKIEKTYYRPNKDGSKELRYRKGIEPGQKEQQQ